MTRSRALMGLVAAPLSLALVAGCGPGGPTDAELAAASDEARATVIAVSDELIAAVQSGNPELTFIDEPDPMGEARSWDCSDNPAPTGEAIQWAANRTWHVEPTQPTDHLLDPLISQLTADGWTLTKDEPKGGARLVRLTRDGYHIDLSGDRVQHEDDPTRVGVSTFSPCLNAVPDAVN